MLLAEVTASAKSNDKNRTNSEYKRYDRFGSG